ncbi:hypothetical protein ACFE04_029707 [Oxalis oulophora]
MIDCSLSNEYDNLHSSNNNNSNNSLHYHQSPFENIYRPICKLSSSANADGGGDGDDDGDGQTSIQSSTTQQQQQQQQPGFSFSAGKEDWNFENEMVAAS